MDSWKVSSSGLFAQQLNSSWPKFKFMLVTLMVLDRTVHSTCELKLVSEAGHFKLEMAQWRATGGRHGHDDRDSHAGSGGRLASDTGDGPALPGDPSGFLTPTTSYVTYDIVRAVVRAEVRFRTFILLRLRLT
jgi:hypothetical protein